MARAKRLAIFLWLLGFGLLAQAVPALSTQAPVPSTVALTKIELVLGFGLANNHTLLSILNPEQVNSFFPVSLN